MDKAKRARTAETPKQPSPGLKLRAPYLYPDKSGICEGLGVKFPGPTRQKQPPTFASATAELAPTPDAKARNRRAAF
jgi:hypothetical protein